MKTNLVRTLVMVLILILCIGNTAMACTEWCGLEYIDEDSDKLPTSAELHVEAYLLGDEMIGRTLHVLRSGYVRTAPNQNSEILTDALPSDEVTILDYYMESINPLSMWLKVDFYGMEAWINASRGKIVTCPADAYTVGNDPMLEMWRSRYVGYIVMVNVKSGYARSGPSQNYPVVKNVERPDTYKVHDVALDAQGNVWLMIRSGSRECWARNTLFSHIDE